jgi:type II secretion system protein H
MTARTALARRAGFTMIEIMLVLILLGLISTVGAWSMVPALDHERVRRATGILSADLQYAQMIAARQRVPVAIIFNTSLKMYLIRDRADTTVYRERFLGDDSDFNLDKLEATSSSVEVFPTGAATETVTITLGVGDYERQVRITRAGHVRILSFGGG